MRTRARAARAGFSLIEVLITIAIVLTLGAIVAVNVMGTQESAEQDIAQIELDALEDGLRFFRLEFGRYPTDEEGIAVLWSDETLDVEDDAERSNWREFLEDEKPTDPWGNEWGYRAEPEYGENYDLWSNGPDGEEGTDDDIVTWDEDDAGVGGAPSGGS